jgi:merlin protein
MKKKKKKINLFCPWSNNSNVFCRIATELVPIVSRMVLSFQYGDYDEATYTPGKLASEDLLPQRVIDQYQMTAEMWEERIKVWYSDRRGMTR